MSKSISTSFLCLLVATFPFCMASSFAVDGPLSPEKSLTYLQTEPGLKVELVAAEPMVVDPVAVAWDEKGRMFVVENRGYPTGPAPEARQQDKSCCSKTLEAQGSMTSAPFSRRASHSPMGLCVGTEAST